MRKFFSKSEFFFLYFLVGLLGFVVYLIFFYDASQPTDFFNQRMGGLK